MGSRFCIPVMIVLGGLAWLPCRAQNNSLEIKMGGQAPPPVAAKSRQTTGNAAPNAATTTPTPVAHDSALAERALSESYGLGKELPTEARLQHLISLCSSAAEMPSLQAEERDWAEELYRAAGELAASDELRSHAQSTAVALLAPIDAKRALQLFDTLEAPARAELDPRPWVARVTFSNILKQQGVKAIPGLRARARRLGDTGPYPYSAMVPVLSKLKDQPEKAAQVFADALTYYRQGKDPLNSDMNFISFLRGAHNLKVIPDWLVHEAALELATRVTRGLENSTEPNGPGTFNRSRFYFRAAYSVLQNVDPEVAKNMKEQQPSAIRNPGSMGMVMGSQQQTAAAGVDYRQDPEFQRLGANNEDLIGKIMSMSEDGQQRSPEMQAAIAQAISVGVKQTQRALELDPANEHAIRHNPPALPGVIETASKINPDFTFHEIEGVTDTELRAYLLIQFASGIRELQFMREMDKTDEARPVVREESK